jgi:hypothetical protein
MGGTPMPPTWEWRPSGSIVRLNGSHRLRPCSTYCTSEDDSQERSVGSALGDMRSVGCVCLMRRLSICRCASGHWSECCTTCRKRFGQVVIGESKLIEYEARYPVPTIQLDPHLESALSLLRRTRVNLGFRRNGTGVFIHQDRQHVRHQIPQRGFSSSQCRSEALQIQGDCDDIDDSIQNRYATTRAFSIEYSSASHCGHEGSVSHQSDRDARSPTPLASKTSFPSISSSAMMSEP